MKKYYNSWTLVTVVGENTMLLLVSIRTLSAIFVGRRVNWLKFASPRPVPNNSTPSYL